jgi:uncharacterized repeat protein (TIGR03803 family)
MSQRLPKFNFHVPRRAASIPCAILFLLTAAAMPAAQAQTLTVIHRFTGGADGAEPVAGVTVDAAGNFYGTASSGGTRQGACVGAGCGTVFKETRRGSAWLLSPLYNFAGGNDGVSPSAGVIIGPDGTLFGTTMMGGGGGCFGRGCGIVFNLRPPASVCKSALCPWTETVLYRFTGGNDGGNPGSGNLIFDHAGNIYGTTQRGGTSDAGTVYELSRSGGGWTETVLYSFQQNATDGAVPNAGVIFDQAGNLYGTTIGGGSYGNGTVFELTPSGPGWTEKSIYSFQAESDGAGPYAGVIFDQSGNLYGATISGGPENGGTVFELSPSGGQSWTFTLLYGFSALIGGAPGPASSLIMDRSGNLYGTTEGWIDGNEPGSAFELTRSGTGWVETVLHSFTFGNDGGGPECSLAFDASGNLYGTTFFGGGSDSSGVIFEITP